MIKKPTSIKHLDKLTKKSPLEKKVDILAELVEELGQKVNALLKLEKDRWQSTFKRMGK